MPETINGWLNPFFISLLTSTGIGLIIGIEREFNAVAEKDHDHFAGIRTFPLVAVLGCVITFLSQNGADWLLVVATAAFIALVGVAYYISSIAGQHGVTTEVSLILTFLLGAMTAMEFIREALVVAVITTTLLSLKGKFQAIISQVTEEEIFALVKFIILCMLLFPFLPDEQYGPNGLFNPREIGLVIVLVTGLSFAGYLLAKFAGTGKGTLLTALLGGLISSTAVTWVLSSRSKESDRSFSNIYAAGISLASAVMFIRVALVTFIFNKDVFILLIIPCVLMAVSQGVFAYFLSRGNVKPASESALKLGNPINLLNALGFGVIYVGIGLLVFYSDKHLGNQGLYISGLISGLADVDAITISMAKFAHASSKTEVSVAVIVIAMMSNTLVKGCISYFKGSREMGKKAALALGTAIATGGTYVLIRQLFF